MGKRRRRRSWSDDEKRMICGQARMPGVSVAQVARRYDVNANQVFNWMREARFEAAPGDEAPACFLPVEISPAADSAPSPFRPGSLDIEIAGEVRLKVSGDYDPIALATLLRKLAT
ncbi:MAG: IS66-like element accessory protein TnpA [Pikeienuella sp.]